MSPGHSWGQPAASQLLWASQQLLITLSPLSLELWLMQPAHFGTLAWCASQTPSFRPASHLAALPAPLTPEPQAPGKCSISPEPGVISEGSLQLLKAPKSPESPRALLLQAEQGLIARAAAPLQARVPDSQSPRNLMLRVKNTMFTWCLLPRLEG